MIRITVELISARHPSRNRVLGIATISNTGRGTETRADYRYVIFGGKEKKMHEGRLDNIPRKQMNAWDLIAVILAKERTEIVRRKLGG